MKLKEFNADNCMRIAPANKTANNGRYMRAILISLNWMLSLMGLCIDTESAPMWAIIAVVVWFGSASLLLRYAGKQGWMK